MRSAERLFLANGVEETTIEEITRGADVAKGTFYLHFSSKGDVLEALRARFVRSVLDAIEAGVGARPETDWHGRLAAWARACAAGYLDAARLHHLVFVGAPPASRKGLTRNVLIDSLADLIATGARDEAWTVDDPGFTAIFLFNALHGVVNGAEIDQDEHSRSRLLRALESHFLRTLGLGPAARKS